MTVAGTATLNGNVVLGNASGDDVTITGSLASSIAIKTTNTYNVGSATHGLASVYFGANSQTVRLLPSGSMSATYTITLPTTAGVAGQVLQNTGSGTLQWSQADLVSAKAGNYTITDTDMIRTVVMTNGASSYTVTLPTAADNTDRIISVIKADTGAGTCTVDGEGAETINGATTVVLREQFDRVTLQCNGTTWYKLHNHISPQSMTDAEATRAGLKFYSHGTTYNGSIAPTISGPAGLAVTTSMFIPYMMQDGTWRLKFNFAITHNSLTVIDCTINGVTFSGECPFTGYTGAANDTNAKTTDAASTTTMRLASAAVESKWGGEVALTAKPTWAY